MRDCAHLVCYFAFLSAAMIAPQPLKYATLRACSQLAPTAFLGFIWTSARPHAMRCFKGPSSGGIHVFSTLQRPDSHLTCCGL